MATRGEPLHCPFQKGETRDEEEGRCHQLARLAPNPEGSVKTKAERGGGVRGGSRRGDKCGGGVGSNIRSQLGGYRTIRRGGTRRGRGSEEVV